jgi:hypothetical protein
MKNDSRNISELLEKYHNFDECVLVDIDWRDYGLTVDLAFNYIWQENGTIRANLDAEEIVILRFKLVQELHVIGALNEAKITQPEAVDWGINTVALVKMEEKEEFLNKYRNFSIPFHHVAVRWEYERRIDIVFSDLEVFRKTPRIVGRRGQAGGV